MSDFNEWLTEDDGQDEDDWFSPAKIEGAIAEESRARRADPRHCLGEFLYDLWADNTDEEAYEAWRHRIAFAPQYAQDGLFCLEAVINDPPPDLVAFLRQQSEIYLYHEDATNSSFSEDEALQWLKMLLRDFAEIFEQAQSAGDDDRDAF